MIDLDLQSVDVVVDCGSSIMLNVSRFVMLLMLCLFKVLMWLTVGPNIMLNVCRFVSCLQQQHHDNDVVVSVDFCCVTKHDVGSAKFDN